MWAAARSRFNNFYKNLILTQDQIDDGITKHLGVRQCLNRHYYNSNSYTENSFLIGSWAKNTRVRPPRDIDLYFVLPTNVYYQFQNYAGNKQSALLQEVKNVLQRTYPTTIMRGDGQVVMVGFSSINVEVVPTFALNNGRYWICNTHNGGYYMETDPTTELTHISIVHSTTNNNLRPIIKMLKIWQSHCNVPIKSFHIELIAAEFLRQSPWKLNDYFYYDWILRDFFAFLYSKANTTIYVPGTYESIFLGDLWMSRAETAYYRAAKACEYEYNDWIELAGEEWQKIFGIQIPKTIQKMLALAV